ncbi:unnamed protein product [Tenebrio molitor]|jgi:hypothetical protein|nr:unnamed protein product [Tenebrio molitor]
MSSPPGTPKKKMSETISFIKTTNPEVFQIQPRPGGVLPINVSDFKPVDRPTEDPQQPPPSDLQAQVDEKISKDFRVMTALDETESLNSEDVTMPNPLKDAMYMFGVTVSSLIMMAANHPNIPPEYLDWTENCLSCIRDDFGNHPPNVQGILNHLKYLNRQGGDGGAPPADTGGDGGGGGGGADSGGGAGAGGGGAEGQDEGGEEGAGAAEGEEEGEEGGDEQGEEGDQTVKTTTRVKMGSRDEGQ